MNKKEERNYIKKNRKIERERERERETERETHTHTHKRWEGEGEKANVDSIMLFFIKQHSIQIKNKEFLKFLLHFLFFFFTNFLIFITILMLILLYKENISLKLSPIMKFK